MHADALRIEVDAFRERSPYVFDTSASQKICGTRDVEIVCKVAAAPTIPDSWALITGDVLTNANAALDHAIYQHVREQNPSIPPHRIQYPILDDPQEFAARTSGRFGAEVLSLIEDAQPFHWSNPAAHPLRMLRKLANIDKHRELVVASYVMDAFVVGASELYQVVSTDVLRENGMGVGAVVARARLRVAEHAAPRHYLDVAITPKYGESIEVPGIDQGVDLVVAIDRVIGRMGPYLDALEAAGC
ncbi:hypothetical protein A5671_01320 [Mycolicibacter heraklionensis]|nr:hypothetical protein A5671_01320 [Mycolicibacter heraklionensis]